MAEDLAQSLKQIIHRKQILHEVEKIQSVEAWEFLFDEARREREDQNIIGISNRLASQR